MSINVKEQIKVYNEAIADSVLTDEEKVKLEKAGITEELINKLSGKNQDEVSDIINKYFNSEPEIGSTPWYKRAFATLAGGVIGTAAGSILGKSLKYAKYFGPLGAVAGLLISLTAFNNKKNVQQSPPVMLDEKELEQKSMINSIMETKGNCWNKSKKKLDDIANKIIKYANANNPKADLEEYAANSEKERLRTLAQQMLDEGFADNFSVFAASIIAKESKFLEKSTLLHNINSRNGQGIFQLTSTIVKDLWDNRIGETCLDPELKNRYKSPEKLFEALKDDPEINYQVGIAGLKYKFLYTLDKLKREDDWNIPGGKNTPTTLLEYTAFMYNGNGKIEENADKKENRAFNVRDNYARDVIETFCKATEGRLNTTEYFVCTGYDSTEEHTSKDGKTFHKGINGKYKLVTPSRN